MNVYFDYQIYRLQKYGGISRYFLELARELNTLPNVKAKIIAPFHDNDYLVYKERAPVVFTLNPLVKKMLHNRFIDKEIETNEKVAQLLCHNRRATILHETYYTNRFQVNCPKVITIHDMIYELFNSNLDDEKMVIARKKQAILEADRIIAVSENTKKDVLKFYPDVKNKLRVVHHGVDQSQHLHISKYNHPKPFFLHVGNRGWYKNFHLLLQVFSEQTQIHQQCDLICFGGGQMTKEEEAMLAKGSIFGKVKFISGDDNLLISMYKSALALVYISNYEGFGMPLLEAMALSCPVIASNTSSLPEVYGQAALSINPSESEELAVAMNSILNDQVSREKLIEKGKLNAEKFTWKKCAEETLTVYKDLL